MGILLSQISLESPLSSKKKYSQNSKKIIWESYSYYYLHLARQSHTNPTKSVKDPFLMKKEVAISSNLLIIFNAYKLELVLALCLSCSRCLFFGLLLNECFSKSNVLRSCNLDIGIRTFYEMSLVMHCFCK